MTTIIRRLDKAGQELVLEMWAADVPANVIRTRLTAAGYEPKAHDIMNAVARARGRGDARAVGRRKYTPGRKIILCTECHERRADALARICKRCETRIRAEEREYGKPKSGFPGATQRGS